MNGLEKQLKDNVGRAGEQNKIRETIKMFD